MTIHSVIIQKLLSTNGHLGRRVAAHHFKVYTYGSRNAMTIIDSDKTLICLRNACQFIGNLVRHKGRFLFVNTNNLFDEIIDQMTKRIGCGNDTSWRLGGFLTNSGSPKKFRSRNKKLHLGATQPPDCVVIMDTQRKSSVIYEADKLQIPIVGLVDSSMPWDIYKRITYPVPANDSVQFVYLFCNLITKTFLLEQKRFAAAMGAAVREEEVTTQQLDQSKPETEVEPEKIKQKTSSMNNEIFVIPYESLAIAPDGGCFDIYNADPLDTKKFLDKLVVLKLNSRLGTEIGLDGPKSVIEICNGQTFLDLIINQIESINSKHECNIPLILLNSIRTHDATLKVVEKYSERNIDINTLCERPSHPVNKQQDSKNELCSLEGARKPSTHRGALSKLRHDFDHQELFLSLKNSGTLDALLLQGKEYILVLKSDNLGATIDPKILNHLIQNRIQYCMEVIPNISSDFEGNILHSYEGEFQLSDIAQMPQKHSLEKFKLLDTGNLWMNLKAVKRLFETDALTVESYPVSKKVSDNEILLQDRRATSAIQFFHRIIGVNVPQSRFQPLMATSDLLLVQSDLYTNAEGILTQNSARVKPANPSIELGREFEKLSDFRSRFKSIPSIIELDSLKVTGDVWFGAGITLKGKVTITAKQGMKLEIPDGVVLENKDITDPSGI